MRPPPPPPPPLAIAIRVSGSIAYVNTIRDCYAVTLLLQFLLDLLLRIHVVNGVGLESLQVLHDNDRLLVDLVLEILRRDALVHLQLLQVAVTIAAEVVHRHFGKRILLLAGGVATFLAVKNGTVLYETFNLVGPVEVLIEHLNLINAVESVENDVPDMVVVHEIDGDPLNALPLYKVVQPNGRNLPVASSHTEVEGKGLDETTVSQVI